MHIFRKKKNEHRDEIDLSKFINIKKLDFKTFTELLEQHAGLAFEKQILFGELIGSTTWELDMETSSIKFDNLVFPIQIIGSLSFNDNSWMWGWQINKLRFLIVY